jgi:hypothetical protein
MPWECLNQAWAKPGRDEKVRLALTSPHLGLGAG